MNKKVYLINIKNAQKNNKNNVSNFFLKSITYISCLNSLIFNLILVTTLFGNWTKLYIVS